MPAPVHSSAEGWAVREGRREHRKEGQQDPGNEGDTTRQSSGHIWPQVRAQTGLAF